MSRMTTTCASLSWAMPAMRRACSSDVRGGMLAAVEAEFLDQVGDRRRHQAVDRFAARNAAADVTRSDRQRLDLEEQDALGTLQPLEDGVEPLARITGPRRNGEPRMLEHCVRLLPIKEVAELVRADQQQRVVPPVGAQHVDRAAVRIQLDVVV